MPNGNDVSALLDEYGTSLEDVRKLLPKLVGKLKKTTLPTPQFFTPQEVETMGFTTETGEPFKLEEGWLLKLMPGANGAEPSVSFITPEKWEITQDNQYISPTGEKFTPEELQTQIETPEIPLELKDVFGTVFPKGYSGKDIEETLTWIGESDANLQEFAQAVWEAGRTEDTEGLLAGLGMGEEDIEKFFAPALGITEQAKTGLGAAWEKLTTGEFEWYEIKDTLMGMLGVGGAYLEKYVGRPWEVLVLEMTLRAPAGAAEKEITSEYLKKIDEVFKKYGAAGFFAEEISEIYELPKQEVPGAKLPLTILEYLNPVYLIPIGGAFGQVAKWTTKIPLLGRTMKGVAVGVQAIERGVTYPIVKPMELGLQGLEKVGVNLGEKMVNKLIGESKNLLMEIPESERLIQGIVIDNWVKRTLQITAKIPFIKKGIEKALGWRVLVSREGKLLQDIVGQGSVAYAEIQRMGINTARWKIAELYAIDANPVKLFGFNKSGFSQKMVSKLLPENAGIKEAGTLEHVFTHPEMYSLTEKQLLYVTRVHEVNTLVLNLLKKEGVAPEHVVEDWIHRIVTGRTTAEGEEILVKGRPGMGGRAIGATLAYEKPRTFKTMQEGLEAGYIYDPDITHSVGSYIESAYNKIAAARFEAYTAEFGRTPLERLAERYPGLAERATLTQKELADAANFQSVINRAIRGEKIPEQTLQAIERRFPELGRKFRSLLKGEPMKPIDEAAFQAEFGVKDDFGFPQAMYTRPSSPYGWNLMSHEERVAWCERVGLEPNLGYRPWDVLTVEQQNKILMAETVKPKIEGVAELTSKTEIKQIKLNLSATLSEAERKAQLTSLRNEVKALTEARKAPYWQARAEKAAKMEIVRQPGIGEGYIMQPFAGGRIYSQEFIDSFNKFFGYDKGLGVLKVTGDIAGIMRITKASLDFSAMAIQGLPSFGLAHAYMLTNPSIGAKLLGRWYQAFGYSVGSFFNPDIFWKYMAKQGGSIGQRISFGGSSRAVDYFTALEARGGLGGFGEKILSNIPLHPFERAQISFYAAGEVVRDEFWKILSPKALLKGKEFELARHLDLITGLFEARAAGVPLTVRQFESAFMWFAPNYTRACLTVLADIFRGGYTGAMAKKALGGLIAAGAAYYTGVQFAISSLEGKSPEEAWQTVMEGFGVKEDPITHEVTWKPTAQFMTLKVGNYYFGFGGFWYGLVRLAGNINDCVNEVGDKEIVDLIKILENGLPNKDNPFVYWWLSRASPLTGTGFELATGKDFLGYPIETPEQYAKYILTRFEPIWMEQGINWLIPGMARDNEIPEGLAREAVPVLEMFGLRTFPESQWVKFYDKADELIQHIPEDELDPKQLEAWRKGELGWAQLTDIQKSNLLARYPELAEIYGVAQADSAVRQSKEWEAYTTRIEEERGIYYKRIEDLTQQLLRGEIDTATYREKAGEAGQNYGAILDAMQRDPTYAQIYDYFDKREAEGDKYGFLDDLALAEYQSTILYAEDLTMPNGDYNWDERDKRVDAFIEKWGQDVYDRIQQYLTQEKGLKGLNEVWIRKSQDTEKLGRSYWRLPYKPIIEMDATDEAEGNIPAQYYTDWKTYQTLSDADKEAFLVDHPDLAKDFRAEYRKSNPEADAMLALWGYGGKLQSMEAYNLVEKWSKELGIPLESMGLGLPPRSLIEDYFGYGDLIRQFSGNSAEAKLWKLEHPNFTNWAMENWGWEGTEDYRGMEYYSLQIKWRDVEAEYSAIEDKEARTAFLESHPEFRDDRRRLQAMDYQLPEDIIPDYVEYYKVSRTGYEDDWFLMEHKDFYEAMIDPAIMGENAWKPRDFSKIPTREVSTLWETYQNLPKGKDRLDFRAKHPDLDQWMLLTGKVSKLVGDRGDKEAPETEWEKLEKVKKFQEKFD